MVGLVLLAVAGTVLVAVDVSVVYLSLTFLHLRADPITTLDPSRDARLAYAMIGAEFAAIFGWFAFVRPLFPPEAPYYYDETTVLRNVLFTVLLFLPLVVALKATRQNQASIGITTQHASRMAGLGILWSGIFTAVVGIAPLLGLGSFAGASSSVLYGLVAFLLTGFRGEIVWRGYIQTRLVAQSGLFKGILTTSLFFALWHFPAEYYSFSGAVFPALTNILIVFPISLLFAYIMLRCQNILPGSIAHAFYDWRFLLWSVPVALA